MVAILGLIIPWDKHALTAEDKVLYSVLTYAGLVTVTVILLRRLHARRVGVLEPKAFRILQHIIVLRAVEQETKMLQSLALHVTVLKS